MRNKIIRSLTFLRVCKRGGIFIKICSAPISSNALFKQALILLSMFILVTGCSQAYDCVESKLDSESGSKEACLFSVSDGSKEYKQARRNYKFATILNSYFFLSQYRNICLERTNIDITSGQILGPFTEEQCFRITVTGNTFVKMITPGTTTGYVDVWSSDLIPLIQRVPGVDDPILPIPSPGIWYANLYCSSCMSYSISIP